jgi:hypothetical protein
VAAGDLSDEDHARAYLAGQLLASWRQLPGGDGCALEEWVRRARALLAERKLWRDGDYEIGKVLKWAGEDPDGCWPPIHVRAVIEEEGSQDVERGLEHEVFSSRGATWRGIADGGAQERELAERYTSLRKKAGVAFPRTRRMLTRIADRWDSVARQEDALAEHREEFWS